MATTKTDRFHDDLIDLLRKYDVEPDRKGNPGLYLAYEDLLTEVEKVHEAEPPATACDHCGGKVTRLHLVRGENLALCAICRDGLAHDSAVGNDEPPVPCDDEIADAAERRRLANGED